MDVWSFRLLGIDPNGSKRKSQDAKPSNTIRPELCQAKGEMFVLPDRSEKKGKHKY